MTKAVQTLFAGALKLPEKQRAELAKLLLDSLEPSDGSPEEIEAAWVEEIKRRIEEIDSGAVKLIPWETVRADLERRFPSAPRKKRRR